MVRILGIALAAAIALPSPIRGEPVQKIFQVGVVFNALPMSELQGPVPASTSARALIEGLRERGWVDGRNIRIHWRSAEQRYERRPDLFEELLRLRVDLLIVSGNIATREVLQKSRSVPVVTVGMLSPVEQGIVASYARPGGSVTGIALDTGPEVHGKRLALLKQSAPRVTRIASLQPWYATGENSEEMGASTVAAARALDLAIFPQRFESVDDIERAIDAAVRRGANALYVANYQPFSRKENQERIQRAAERHRLPVMYVYQGSADNGGLIAYSPDLFAAYRRAGYIVDRILKGARPADIPVEQPSKYELVINLKAARAIGLDVPSAVFAEADRVIK